MILGYLNGNISKGKGEKYAGEKYASIMYKVNRVLYFLVIGLVSCSGGEQIEEIDISGKPNVVIITWHDTGRWFGCYGNEFVHTPHIDHLA
jgi:hypothetical protein